MRIAATADLHFTPQRYAVYAISSARFATTLTCWCWPGLDNYGQPAEMEPLVNALVRLRVPTVAVLGNHDYESGREADLMQMMTVEGIKVLGWERL